MLTTSSKSVPLIYCHRCEAIHTFTDQISICQTEGYSSSDPFTSFFSLAKQESFFSSSMLSSFLASLCTLFPFLTLQTLLMSSLFHFSSVFLHGTYSLLLPQYYSFLNILHPWPSLTLESDSLPFTFPSSSKFPFSKQN